MARNLFDSLKDPQIVDHFALEVQGIEEATFQEASGFESTSDVVEQRENGKGGKQYISKQPGNLKWGDITLKRGMTDSMDLWKWRQAVIDGNMAQARKDGSVVFYNAMNVEINRYSFKRGWPVKWTGASPNTKNSAVGEESITIAHEGLVRSS
jgi:phage tail-like protein